MKYKFRRSGRQTNKLISKSTRFRLMGRDTLRALPRLPAEREKIIIDGDFRKKRTYDFSAVKRKLNTLYSRIYRTIKEICREVYLFSKKAVLGLAYIISVIARTAWAILPKHINEKYFSTPMLLGALTAACLVLTVTVSYMTLFLFAPYVRAYDTVTIPKFLNESDIAALGEDTNFNIIIEYEENPDIPSGRVISQTPKAGVSRRIYKKGDFCDIHLTISRHRTLIVPDGLEGASVRDATLLLRNSQLDFIIKEEPSAFEENGQVISVFPISGSAVGYGERVTLVVAAN